MFCSYIVSVMKSVELFWFKIIFGVMLKIFKNIGISEVLFE